jgi:hypothetical protein
MALALTGTCNKGAFHRSGIDTAVTMRKIAFIAYYEHRIVLL